MDIQMQEKKKNTNPSLISLQKLTQNGSQTYM